MAKNEKKETKKVKRPSRLKRLIQSKANRERNRSFIAKTKTAMKKLETLIAANQAEHIHEQLNEVYSLLDKAVKKGMLKLNKASRDKARASRLAAKATA